MKFIFIWKSMLCVFLLPFFVVDGRLKYCWLMQDFLSKKKCCIFDWG